MLSAAVVPFKTMQDINHRLAKLEAFDQRGVREAGGKSAPSGGESKTLGPVRGDKEEGGLPGPKTEQGSTQDMGNGSARHETGRGSAAEGTSRGTVYSRSDGSVLRGIEGSAQSTSGESAATERSTSGSPSSAAQRGSHRR